MHRLQNPSCPLVEKKKAGRKPKHTTRTDEVEYYETNPFLIEDLIASEQSSEDYTENQQVDEESYNNDEAENEGQNYDTTEEEETEEEVFKASSPPSGKTVSSKARKSILSVEATINCPGSDHVQT